MLLLSQSTPLPSPHSQHHISSPHPLRLTQSTPPLFASYSPTTLTAPRAGHSTSLRLMQSHLIPSAQIASLFLVVQFSLPLSSSCSPPHLSSPHTVHSIISLLLVQYAPLCSPHTVYSISVSLMRYTTHSTRHAVQLIPFAQIASLLLVFRSTCSLRPIQTSTRADRLTAQLTPGDPSDKSVPGKCILGRDPATFGLSHPRMLLLL